MRQDRSRHQAEVNRFLQKHFGVRDWTFTLPRGTGNETYFAHGGEHALFIKLGAHLERAEAMSDASLSPPVLAAGHLEDGTAIVVQVYVEGRPPSWSDYHRHIEQVAQLVRRMHHDEAVRKTLPSVPSHYYREAALRSLAQLRERWELSRPLVPTVADFIEASLDRIRGEIDQITGSGLVASHNDFNRTNLLLTPEGRLYVLDLEDMSHDDPARDVGAVLWWYYPPEMRPRFLEIASYDDTQEFRERMRLRMATHCLSITLPRPGSFDTFDPECYAERLDDFRAALEGEENPRGYED